jgi:predicted Zn-dependent peptidase
MITSHTSTLPNGLRLVAVEMPHLHSAEIAVYIKSGGRNDPEGKAGLSHFLEHMLFRGTTEHPTTLELEIAFEAIGGSVNASTDEETTCYYSRIHPQHVAEGIALFSSLLLRPTLLDLEVEKRIVIEEALDDINDKGEEINPHNLASRLLWPGHPLGCPTVGFLESIRSFTVEDLRLHLSRYYVPGNVVIVVSGDVKAETVFNACAAHFGGWTGDAPSDFAPVHHHQESPRRLLVKDADSQVHLQVAFRGFSRFDPRIMTVRMVRRILCGGGASRLHLELRERLGLVYSVDASIAAYAETGAFAIELSTAPENLPEATAKVLEATARLVGEPVPPEELARVREGYLFDLEYSRDSTYEMGVRYGWGELMGIVRRIEEDQEEVLAVGPAEVQAVARELFAPEALNLVAVGPLKGADQRRFDALLADYGTRYRNAL